MWTTDGRFEFVLGGPAQDRNWIGLTEEASRLTIRHYWEQPDHPAVPPAPDLAMEIALVDGDVPSGPRAPTDDSVAASIRRVGRYVRSRTIETIFKPGDVEPPAFVSRIPHEFPAPSKPGKHALAAADASYSMAPYLLGPDEALVITARWPDCRCANVNLWNRQMQTFDYLRHPISLNRAQTVFDPDGSFRVDHRGQGSGSRELARHRRSALRARLLALHAPRRTDRHAEGRGRPARVTGLSTTSPTHGSSSTSKPVR